MTQRSSDSGSSQFVHPLEVIKKEWSITRQSIQMEGLVVSHSLKLPSEIQVSSGFTSHLLGVLLGYEKRRITSIEGQKYDGETHRGEFLLFPARMSLSHAWETANPCFTFILDPLFLVRVAQETNCLNPNKIELLPVLKNYDSQIKSLALFFLQEMLSEQLGSQLYYESLANLFAIHLLRKYCVFEPKLREYKGGLSPHKLQQAIDFIHDNLERKLTLNEMAAQLNLSTFYFCELFKKSTGTPPYTYVLQQRVKRAQQLLKNQKKTISDIALECGFASHTHLNKHFRKFTGQTPKKYRQQLY